ncbi:MAG TPA: M28 family peptidase, partial [Gemmatimonadaceae bacterium]
MRTLTSALLLAISAAAAAQNNQYGNPEKRAPRPTSAAISEADLMSRLYVFADDSMEGRNAPLASNAKGTAYIVRELQRLRIAPAGYLGSYYQTLPYVSRSLSPRTSLTINGEPLRLGTDFTVTSRGATKIIDSATVIFAGVSNDADRMIVPEWANNRFVIVLPPPPASEAAPAGGRGGGAGFGRGGGAGTVVPVNAAARYAGAVAVATVVPDVNNPPATGGFGGRGGGRGGVAGPVTVLNDLSAPRVAAQFYITPAAAAKLLGRPVEGAGPGTTHDHVSAAIFYDDTDIPHASNVLAIIPGSDPVLKNEYVLVSAHNDHVGLTGPNAQGQSTAVDHDSLRTARLALLRMQMQGGELVPNAPGTTVTVNMDSLRRIRPPRRDSIRNGADDDGSGSMGVLEIAEAIAAMPVKPKRSTIFAWWTAEEDGLVGSRWFSDNPTVPLNQIVTNINMDMIGRGRAEDVPGGGPDYLGFLGA